MGNIAPTPTGTTISQGETPEGIKIDPALARTGKSGEILNDFEQKTGIPADELVDGLNSGKSVADILGGKGKMGMSADEIQAGIDKANADGLMSGDEVMAKIGVKPEDLAANTDPTYGNGSGASRSPASTAPAADFNSLFGANAKDAGSGVIENKEKKLGLSPDVQAALDRNGITELSLFQMVSAQYKRKTPMLFGVPTKNSVSAPDNPFGDLSKGEKIQF
jgi:hypothetical protein